MAPLPLDAAAYAAAKAFARAAPQGTPIYPRTLILADRWWLQTAPGAVPTPLGTDRAQLREVA